MSQYAKLRLKKCPAPKGAELSLREGAGVSAGIHTSIYIILTKLLPVKPRLPRIDAGGLGPISVYLHVLGKKPARRPEPRSGAVGLNKKTGAHFGTVRL